MDSCQLDKLTPDDILYQIYCLCKWFLYLAKDEHLQERQPKTVGKEWGSPSWYAPFGISLAGTCIPSFSHSHPLKKLSSSWLVS